MGISLIYADTLEYNNNCRLQIDRVFYSEDRTLRLLPLYTTHQLDQLVD
jgi:hypothetical protein